MDGFGFLFRNHRFAKGDFPLAKHEWDFMGF